MKRMKPSSSAQQFCGAVEAALSQLADATKAPGMRAYVRDKFVYLGITTPERRAAVKVLIRGLLPFKPRRSRAQRLRFGGWSIANTNTQPPTCWTGTRPH
jgi:hypothetical protein